MALTTGIGMHVMSGMLNNNADDTDFLRKTEEIRQEIIKNNTEEAVEERKSQIKKWATIANEVIAPELIDSYKATLTDFVAYGPSNGSLMDLSMSILSELKVSDTMDYAEELLNSVEDKLDRFYIQNMAFMYSDKGPDFVTRTIGRPLTVSEIACFDLKRVENKNRKAN